MKLSIVIPALNEEGAIDDMIRRCLDARRTIVERSPVSDVEIIVVDDGSTDRTAEIAARHGEIRLIRLGKNCGYGAAIKQGFETGTGELVGFLDADGTCDPEFFANLCVALVGENASVAIGSRLGRESRMPAIRKLGNRVYALILSALSNKVVTDTASGMRVIRRDVLPMLYPLPDGLNFTPAMSARVLMDDRLAIIERPMRYEERIGASKLNVVGDGVRFLRTILEISLVWRPGRMFAAGAVGCLVSMVLLAGHPLETWLRQGRLQEDMIYRLLFCSLLGSVAMALLSAAIVSRGLKTLLDGAQRGDTFWGTLLDRTYTFRGLAMISALSTPALSWLVGPGVWTWTTRGYVTIHWSRVVLAGLIVFGLSQMLITVLTANVIRFHAARRATSSTPRATKTVGAPATSATAQASWGAAGRVFGEPGGEQIGGCETPMEPGPAVVHGSAR